MILILQIAGGIVIGALLLVLIFVCWNAIAEARAASYIRKVEEEEAERMMRNGYVWFMGGWVKQGKESISPDRPPEVRRSTMTIRPQQRE